MNDVLSLEELKNRVSLGKNIVAVVNDLSVGQSCVAGGILRDYTAKQLFGIDLEGSGDVDLLLVNDDHTDLGDFAAEISGHLNNTGMACRIVAVDYSYEAAGDYTDADDRLYGVMQFNVNGVEVDILVYSDNIESIGDAIDTFNCIINKFFTDEYGNIMQDYHPGNSEFEYREGDREKNEERYQKCVRNHITWLRAALKRQEGKSGLPYSEEELEKLATYLQGNGKPEAPKAAHPYQRIDQE